MAPSSVKKKRVQRNNSHAKSTKSPSPSSSTTTAVDSEPDVQQANNSDDIETFWDIDMYSNNGITESDRLILPKRTFIDIEALDGELTNDYEIVDTEDEENTTKDAKLRQPTEKRPSTSLSLSLSTAIKSKQRRLDRDNGVSSKGTKVTTAIASTSGSHNKTLTDVKRPSLFPRVMDTPLPVPTSKGTNKEKAALSALQKVNVYLDSRWDPWAKYELESILQHKIYRNRVLRYEVKWKGYPDSENTWEPAASLHEDCRAFVLKYWRTIPENMRPTNVPVDSIEVETSEGKGKGKGKGITTQKGTGKMKQQALSKEVVLLDDDDDDSSDSDDSNGDSALGLKGKNNSSSVNGGGNSNMKLGKASASSVAGLVTHMKDGDLSTNSKSGTVDDSYKAITKKKNIRQKDMATNYKDYRFIYASKTTVDPDTLDWTRSTLIISNILPLKKDRSQLIAYVIWPNNTKTAHLVEELHDKCPKKLLKFYEERIQFVL